MYNGLYKIREAIINIYHRIKNNMISRTEHPQGPNFKHHVQSPEKVRPDKKLAKKKTN